MTTKSSSQFSRVNFFPIPESSTNMQKAAYHYINFCKFVASTYCLSEENPLPSRILHILSIGCLTRIAFYSHWLSIAIITVIMATKIIANHYFPISPPQQLPADTITSPQSLADTIENATGCLIPIDIAELMLSFLPYELKGILKQTLTGHADGIFRIIELKNGLLASVSYDDTIRIWDLRNPRCSHHITRAYTLHQPYYRATKRSSRFDIY